MAHERVAAPDVNTSGVILEPVTAQPAAAAGPPPGLGLGLRLGLLLAAVVLIVSLGRLLAIGLAERSALPTLQSGRLSRGLANATTFANGERTRTLLSAEAAASAGGLADAITATNAARTLALVQAARKIGSPSLLAALDTSGHLVAADPATNLPLAQAAPVKQALAGKGATVAAWEDASGLYLVAAAPVQRGDTLVGVTVALARLDDNFVTNAVRDSGLAGALLVDNRLVGASPAVRTRASMTRPPTVHLVPSSIPDRPGDLSVGDANFLVASQEIASFGPGRGVTFVVGLPAPPGGLAALAPTAPGQLMVDLASILLATLLAGGVGWLVGNAISRDLLRLREPAGSTGRPGGRELALLADALAGERAASQQREAAAQAEVSHLRTVLDAVGEGIVVSDRERRVILANRAAHAFLGVAGAVDGVIALLPPAQGATEIRANARILRTYSAPLADEGGFSGVVTVLRDATAEQESERLRGELISIVSHELQTPLAAIVGAADLLLEGDPGRLTTEQTRFLSAIRRNGDRLIALVSDLLDVSRLEEGRVELDQQPIDLGGLARALARTMGNLFEQKGVSLRVDAPAGPTEPFPPVLGDRRRLEQVVANLLANAAQYTPSGGHVWLQVTAEPGEVALSIADDGPGIAESDQAQIFEKFYRGTNATTRRERGSGLGLAIARSLVELHNGRIWVESVPGHGARFTVRLPIAPGEVE